MPLPALTSSPVAIQREVLRITVAQLRVMTLLAEQLTNLASKHLQDDAEGATALQQIVIALNTLVSRIQAGVVAEKSSWDEEHRPIVAFNTRVSAVSTSAEQPDDNKLTSGKARPSVISRISKVSTFTGGTWISGMSATNTFRSKRSSRRTCQSYQTYSSEALVTASDIKSSEWELLATPFHVLLSSNMVISSRLGAALERRRCLSVCVLILLGLSLVVEICQTLFLGTLVRASAIVSAQEVRYYDRRPAMGFKYLSISLILGSTYFCFHRANRQILLKSVRHFDPFILFACLTLYQCMALFNRHRSLGHNYDTHWIIMDVFQVFSLTGAHLLIANIDSFSASRKFKIWFSCLILSFYCFKWVTARCFEERWGNVSDCRELEIDGATRRELYLQFLGQATVFLFKALCGIFSGHIFATIRPSFVLTKSWMTRPEGIMTNQDLHLAYSPNSFPGSPSPTTPTKRPLHIVKSPDQGESESDDSRAVQVQEAAVPRAMAPSLDDFKLHASLADILGDPCLTGRRALPHGKLSL